VSAITSFARRNPLPTFYLLAYAISWGIWVPMAAIGIDIGSTLGAALHVAAIFGPTMAALLLTVMTRRGHGIRVLLTSLLQWRVDPRWYAIAVFMFPATMLLAIGATAALGGAAPDFSSPASLAILLALDSLMIVAGSIGEEVGWRGYALPRHLHSRAPLTASVMLGALWGVWHTPVYFVSGTGQFLTAQTSGSFIVPYLGFLVWTIGLSVLFTWLLLNTGGSLLIAVLFHASINIAAYLPSSFGTPGSVAPLINVLLTWLIAVLASRSSAFSRFAPSDRWLDEYQAG
jgi:membrane protease YdiL (CAAX protease family)